MEMKIPPGTPITAGILKGGMTTTGTPNWMKRFCRKTFENRETFPIMYCYVHDFETDVFSPLLHLKNGREAGRGGTDLFMRMLPVIPKTISSPQQFEL